jgi:hypothetical protein
MTDPALKPPFLLVLSLDPHSAAMVPELKRHNELHKTPSLVHLDHRDPLPVVPLRCVRRPQAPEMVVDMVVSLLER